MLWTCFHFNACWLILHFIVLLSKRATLSVLLVVLLIYIYQKKSCFSKNAISTQNTHSNYFKMIFYLDELISSKFYLTFAYLILSTHFVKYKFYSKSFLQFKLKKKKSKFFFKTCILITSDLKKLFTTTSI